jgi:hypothetical protein
MALLTRRSALVLSGQLIVAAALAPLGAQVMAGSQRYTAIVMNMGSNPAGGGRVAVVIERWSSEPERARLFGVFKAQGAEKLLEAMRDSPTVGSVRLPNGQQSELRYAFESTLPQGGRRVVVATDRPIRSQEARSGSSRLDYPFTLIELRFDRDGVGDGRLSVYSKIVLSQDQQTLEFEDYGSERGRLTEVRRDD